MPTLSRPTVTRSSSSTARLLVQALSRDAQRLLAVTEEDAIDTPVSELLMPADAETASRTGFAAAIADAAQGLEADVTRSFVRPWNTFGVRMRAKIAMCGPPRAALIVLDDDRPPAPRVHRICAATRSCRCGQSASAFRQASRLRACRGGRYERAGAGARTAGAPNVASAAGSRTDPSSCWPFSSSAMIVRPTATAVPLRVAT